MRFLVLSVAFACVVPAYAGSSGSDRMPVELPEIGEGWQYEVSGLGKQVARVKFANAEAEWALYWGPHSYLYAISHYQVFPKKETGLFAPERGGKRYHGHEVVAWHEDVNGLPFLRIFVKKGRHRWCEIDRSSPEWIRERSIVLRLWSAHVLVGAYGNNSASLTF